MEKKKNSKLCRALDRKWVAFEASSVMSEKLLTHKYPIMAFCWSTDFGSNVSLSTSPLKHFRSEVCIEANYN